MVLTERAPSAGKEISHIYRYFLDLESGPHAKRMSLVPGPPLRRGSPNFDHGTDIFATLTFLRPGH